MTHLKRNNKLTTLSILSVLFLATILFSCSEEKFQELLTNSLIRKAGKDTDDKRLPIAYLKEAKTLLEEWS